MKKIILGLLIATAGSSFAQYTAKDVFTSKSIVWYGLNFTAAKITGEFDGSPASLSEIKNKWIPQWNSVIQTEQQHYKLVEAFQKDMIYYDVAPTNKVNYELNDAEIVTFNHSTFADPKKTVTDAISKLPAGDKAEGLGVTFVVESYDKTATSATVYVVVFDIKTKNILVLDRVVGKPMGVGVRNYWSGAIKHIIKQINEEYYRKWKSLAK